MTGRKTLNSEEEASGRPASNARKKVLSPRGMGDGTVETKEKEPDIPYITAY